MPASATTRTAFHPFSHSSPFFIFNMNIFDIETCAAPDAELADVMPEFRAPANYKDASKISAYINEAEQEWRAKAALSAVTGRVLCIGVMDGETFRLLDGEERTAISQFWRLWQKRPGPWAGWNIKGFDLPFLVQRSWAHSLPVPCDVFEGRYFNIKFIDLMEKWSCGRPELRLSLDTAARTLGVGKKLGHGADFARLWATDRPTAIDYLRNDLMLTKEIAGRMIATNEMTYE